MGNRDFAQSHSFVRYTLDFLVYWITASTDVHSLSWQFWGDEIFTHLSCMKFIHILISSQLGSVREFLCIGEILYSGSENIHVHSECCGDSKICETFYSQNIPASRPRRERVSLIEDKGFIQKYTASFVVYLWTPSSSPVDWVCSLCLLYYRLQVWSSFCRY